MGNHTIFQMFENPRRSRQARNFTTNVPKILDLKSSSEQIFSENCRWVPLIKTVGISWHIYSLLDDSRQFLRIKTRLNNIFSEKDSRKRENDLLNHDILLILIKRVLLIGLSSDWMPKWRFLFVRQEKGKVCMLL